MTLPNPAPEVVHDTEEYWKATSEGRLAIPYCNSCGEAVWYPRGHCPNCMSRDLTYRDLSGKGEIYTYSIVYRGEGAYAESVPYVIAYVELEEGPRVMTNIVDVDLETIACGMAVEAVFNETSEGNALVRFRPSSA